jgi:DNA-binding NarL/FixJ family response regulator
MAAALRVILVDDHKLMRAGIRCLLNEFGGVVVIAEAGDGREAIELVEKHQPELVLMDIVMPRLGGIEATHAIVKKNPKVRVLMLSMHATEEYVLKSLRAGATGYIHKAASKSEFRLAIETVGNGEIFLSPVVSKHVIEAYLSLSSVQEGSLEPLTPRQREILQLIAEGQSSKQIAQSLNSSVKTIESHRASIMERLGIHNLPGLVRYAIRRGLVSVDE